MSMFAMMGDALPIVASSRVRLARNLKGYHFGKQSPAIQKEMAEKAFAVLQNVPALAEEFQLAAIEPRTAQAMRLVEQHLISPDLAQNGGWAILSRDGFVSIMVGEEDHLRLQVLGRGLCPKECLAEAQRLVTLLESQLPMAYDARLGYLTACPTNIGTGLRVSVMLHLPMLTMTGGVPSVMNWAGRQGCVLRGAFGEGTGAEGGFYQLSNQVTLGVSEEMLAARLLEMAQKLVETEQQARKTVFARDQAGMEDQVCRAAGLLMAARRIGTQEAEGLLSQVLVGLSLGIVGGITPLEIYAATRDLRPASLTIDAGKSLAALERDLCRATMLRKKVGSKLQILLETV